MCFVVFSLPLLSPIRLYLNYGGVPLNLPYLGCVLVWARNLGTGSGLFLSLFIYLVCFVSVHDLAIWSFFLTVPLWFVFLISYFLFFFSSSVPPHLFLYLSLSFFFDYWCYSPYVFYQYHNSLLQNTLNYIHPLIVTSVTTGWFFLILFLFFIFLNPKTLLFGLFYSFHRLRYLCIKINGASIALLLGCFWAAQLDNWGGWWAWESSELLLLILVFLLLVWVHVSAAVTCLWFIYYCLCCSFYYYSLSWAWVFVWNPNSLHSFSFSGLLFFSHYWVLFIISIISYFFFWYPNYLLSFFRNYIPSPFILSLFLFFVVIWGYQYSYAYFVCFCSLFFFSLFYLFFPYLVVFSVHLFFFISLVVCLGEFSYFLKTLCYFSNTFLFRFLSSGLTFCFLSNTWSYLTPVIVSEFSLYSLGKFLLVPYYSAGVYFFLSPFLCLCAFP